MRIVAPLFIILLASMCRTTSSPPQDPAPQLRVLASGAYGASAQRSVDAQTPDAALEIARDERSYVDAWSRIVGSGTPPAVDFEKEAVVFLSLGVRSTGGWSVAPKSVTVEGDSARIEAHVMKPDGRTITTMAFTAPFSVVAVSNRSFTRAQWVDQNGEPVVKKPHLEAQ